MSNGVRILTETNTGSQTHIGFMIDAGVRDEDSSWSSGINNFLKVLYLKQSKDRNAIQARRLLQWMGSSVERS